MLLLAAPCLPQADTRPPRPAEIEALIEMARALPADYAADALLRLAGSNRVSDPAWKRELLEEAFRLAPGAQHPYKRRFVAPLGAGSSREWILGQAYELELDTLSLECRAVRGMLAIDRGRARELFARIPPLNLPPPSCEDALVADVRLFYDTLETLAEQGFTAAERTRGDDAELIASRIRLIASPLELTPAAVLVRSVKLGAEERRGLVTAYADRLAQISRNGAELSFAARDLELASQPVTLAEAARRQGIMADGLMRSYREYLVKYLSGPRCDDRGPNGELIESFASSWLEQFNERLRLPPRLVTTELPPISPEEVSVPATGTRAKIQELYTTPKAKELDRRLQHLRSGGGDAALPLDQRVEPDWQAEAEQFLGVLEDWTPEDGNAQANFHQKAGFYLDLIELAPPGPLAGRIARSCVSFLSDHPMEKSHPIEFLFELQRLLKLARSPAEPAAAGPFEPIGRPNPGGPAIRSELANSRDAVIALYSGLGRIAR